MLQTPMMTKDNNVLLEPLSCIFRMGLLNYKEETRLEYYKEDKKTITETHYYNDGQSIITDATVFHKCFNQTPDWRYSLQITFRDEVDSINNIINS